VSASPPLIEARGLAIGYAGTVIARDIYVTLRAGEVVCLLGPNGSGKTTLFKTLLGLIGRLAGSVAVAGRAIERVQLPIDLVGAVMFLSSAASDFMTGQTINVDGGKAMH